MIENETYDRDPFVPKISTILHLRRCMPDRFHRDERIVLEYLYNEFFHKHRNQPKKMLDENLRRFYRIVFLTKKNYR